MSGPKVAAYRHRVLAHDTRRHCRAQLLGRLRQRWLIALAPNVSGQRSRQRVASVEGTSPMTKYQVLLD